MNSIDWLIEKYTIVCGLGSKELMKEHIERAKAMHKEECIKYYVDGVDYGDMGEHIRESLIEIAEKIYNETFNK